MPSKNLGKLKDAILEGEDEEAEELAKRLLAEKATVEDILGAMQDGLLESGKKLEKKEYFVADLSMSGEAAKKVMDVLLPQIEKQKAKFKGTYVIGSARSDVHDIGKNLVTAYLRGAGFKVIDLGVDVSAEKFVETAKKYGAQIIGVSAYNTSVADVQFPLLKKAFIDEELRDKVKLMLGGAGAYRDMVIQYGFDGFGRDALDAVAESKKMLEDLRGE
jgi:5-methyltetrahydrofolate--homocysteine methyltransferase